MGVPLVGELDCGHDNSRVQRVDRQSTLQDLRKPPILLWEEEPCGLNESLLGMLVGSLGKPQEAGALGEELCSQG